MNTVISKALESLASKFPELLFLVIVVFVIIYIIRKIFSYNSEIEKRIKEEVNSGIYTLLGDVANISAKLKEELQKLTHDKDKVKEEIENIQSLFKTAQAEVESLTSITKKYIDAIDDLGKQASSRQILEKLIAEEDHATKAVLAKQLLNHKDASAQELELAGDKMREIHRNDLSRQLYEKATEKDKDRIGPQIELNALLAETDADKRKEAINNLINLIMKYPKNVYFKRVLNVLIELDKYEEMRAFTEEIIKLAEGKEKNEDSRSSALYKPLLSTAYRNYALALKELGNIEEAMEAVKKALEISDDENNYKLYVSIIEDGVEQKAEGYTIEKLVDESKQLLLMDPLDVSYYRRYIRALKKAKRYDEAVKYIEKAIEISDSVLDQYRFEEEKKRIELLQELENGLDLGGNS